MRLRGEVGVLRRDQEEWNRLRAEQAERDRAGEAQTLEEKVQKAVEDAFRRQNEFHDSVGARVPIVRPRPRWADGEDF